MWLGSWCEVGSAVDAGVGGGNERKGPRRNVGGRWILPAAAGRRGANGGGWGGWERFYTGFAARQAYLHGNDMRRGRTDGVPPVAVVKLEGFRGGGEGGERSASGNSETAMVFRAQVLNVAAKCIGYYG